MSPVRLVSSASFIPSKTRKNDSTVAILCNKCLTKSKVFFFHQRIFFVRYRRRVSRAYRRECAVYRLYSRGLSSRCTCDAHHAILHPCSRSSQKSLILLLILALTSWMVWNDSFKKSLSSSASALLVWASQCTRFGRFAKRQMTGVTCTPPSALARNLEQKNLRSRAGF